VFQNLPFVGQGTKGYRDRLTEARFLQKLQLWRSHEEPTRFHRQVASVSGEAA